MKRIRSIAAGIAAFLVSTTANAEAETWTSEFLNYQVEVVTNLGNFTLQLRGDVAPKTVENFLDYVTAGAYSNSLIHRSVPGFVVQGGGFRVEGEGTDFDVLDIPADDPVENEFNLSNLRGTVAMAKLGGDPDSATNQWFVNVANNSSKLDNQNGGFTVFAEVVGSGMGVVDAINALEPWNFGEPYSSLPLVNYDGESDVDFEQLVVIESVTLLIDFFGLQPSNTRKRDSFWFGKFDQRHFNHDTNHGWVFHDEHEWLFATGKGFAEGIWLWDHIQQDWLWTRADVYPFLYSNNKDAWLFYEKGGKPKERWFYSYEEGVEDWFPVMKQ